MRVYRRQTQAQGLQGGVLRAVRAEKDEEENNKREKRSEGTRAREKTFFFLRFLFLFLRPPPTDWPTGHLHLPVFMGFSFTPLCASKG